MNPLLQQMLATQSVVTDAGTISLRHPEFPDRFSHVGRSTGELLQRAVADVQPKL